MEPGAEERRRLVALLIEGQGTLDAADLQRIANGPIMDPCRLYLPAGKITETEWRARQARILRGERV
jgi:hypothetical protein